MAALLSGIAAVVGVAGIGFGGAALFHRFAPIRIGWLLPLVGADLRPDRLGGLFAALVGAVAVPVGVFAVGYSRRERLPRTALVLLPLFVAAMTLVPLAGSVTTFLFAWELMAIVSLLLVLTEHRRAEARTAGVYYAVLTQLGFVGLLIGLLLLSSAAHADTFADLSARVGQLDSATRNAVFVLTFVGFGSKAGLVPLHAWLPRAHPEAPSPVSALMSAAMVSLGVYGIVRFDMQLLGPGTRWWGLVLLLVGAVSAVYGVLQATTATDLKRLLANSTTEHLGLVTLALGAATLLFSIHARAAAGIALTAALLHVVGHAAFKTLAFLAAGSVLAGTGLRDLDRMGGLARRMPATSVLFGVASLGACGLPLGAGFVSEWLLVQALIHAPKHADRVTTTVIPLGVGAVALTTGLGVAAMVKAFGVGFLARPRSDGALKAREASASMLAGMGVAAAACAVVAVAPLTLAGPLGRVLDTLPAGTAAAQTRLDALLRLPGTGASVSPGWLALAVVVATGLAAALTAWGVRRRPRPAASPLWACGADELSERMQYTATSFAEPLQRVFDDVLRPDIDVEVTHHSESRYLVEKVTYRSRVTDAFEARLYDPVVRAVRTVAGWVRRAHPGSVHAYLAYGAAGLFVVLLVTR
jgi:formate hydrogenlyase subunit 3/multisubunit Na+/H+ antiporter MnhD subunit